MCLGIPMQVQTLHDYTAQCSDVNGHVQQVDITLVAPVALGDWLLVHLNIAREALDPQRAEQINQALQALLAIQQGQDFEHFFADLIEREPQLPEHLRKLST